MPLEPDPPKTIEKKKKSQKSQLRVVLDTNALYVTPISLGSASDLVKQEVIDLISTAKYAELEVLWYLPEVVRHERQYQMQREALKLRFAINKIERLLGHNLALTDQTLLGHVETAIEQKKSELGLQEITLDHGLVDWDNLIHAASYRLPPFEAGETEKGFRDALVVESVLQLANESPKTPKLCRIVLVTSDQLLAEAVKSRTAAIANVNVLTNLEELKGLINTLVSDVGEEFIESLKPKASKLFFESSENKETLYYKEKIGDQIRGRFKAELETKPEATTFRKNGQWYIGQPNFVKKQGRRVFWTSRVEIEVEAGTVTRDSDDVSTGLTTSVALAMPPLQPGQPVMTPIGTEAITADFFKTLSYSSLAGLSEKKVTTQKGRDLYEVLWSAEVTVAKELKKVIVEEMKHVGLKCQPIA